MDNTMYVALSRQMTLRREMDIIANNIANSDTTGFKVETAMVRVDESDKAKMVDGPKSLKFVIDDGVIRDFSQGALATTGGTFDLAIEGQGFFKIQTDGGERFTRDGRFTLGADGRLTTQAGDPVMGESGEIAVNPAEGPVAISLDGVVSQNGEHPGGPPPEPRADHGAAEAARGEGLRRARRAVPVSTLQVQILVFLVGLTTTALFGSFMCWLSSAPGYLPLIVGVIAYTITALPGLCARLGENR